MHSLGVLCAVMQDHVCPKCTNDRQTKRSRLLASDLRCGPDSLVHRQLLKFTTLIGRLQHA
jgi:hypothetical protein